MSPNNPLDPKNQDQVSSEPLIRTMQKDIEALSGQSPSGTPESTEPIPEAPAAPMPNVPSDEVPAPPTDLPISEETPSAPSEPLTPSPEPETPVTEPTTSDFSSPETTEPSPEPAETPTDIPLDQLSNGQIEEDSAGAMPTLKPDAEEKSAKETESEIERRRRSEQEEIAPKEFAEAMVGDAGTLEEQRKKVEQLAQAEPKKSRLKLVVIIIAIVTVILLAGGFIFWWNYIRETTPPADEKHLVCQDNQCVEVAGQGADQCQDDSDCAPTIQPPVSLIYIDQTETIELTAEQTDLVYDRIKTAAAKSQSLGTIRRILIKINGPETKYLTLDELIQALGITLPLSNGSAADYTLFFYSQEQGNRLGLVINTAIANLTDQELFDLLKSQEAIMVDALRPLFLDGADQQPFSAEFLDNSYQEVAIRYLNFPDPSLTYDYAIAGNRFILTTSKDSIYAVIDKLAAVEPEPLTEEELEEAQAAEDNANIKASLAQLRAVAEMLYDAESEFSSLCINGELNDENINQGDNIARIEEQILERNNNQAISCYATEENYCIKTTLLTDEICCVDKNNNPVIVDNDMCTAEKIYCSEE